MRRRNSLKASAGFCLFGASTSTMLLGLTGCAHSEQSSRTIQGEPLEVPHSSGQNPPRTAAPTGATDCHIHIFDPRFPRPGGGKGIWATVADYQLFRKRIGVSRCIVVSTTGYQFDNSPVLHGLDQFGSSARGVVAVPLDVSNQELQRLHSHGARGVRLYLIGERSTQPDQLSRYARRVARLGWHLQVTVGRGAEKLVEAEKFLRDLPCPLVLDHFAYIPQPTGLQHPGVAVVSRLLEKGNTYIKLSAPYITSREGPPSYSDLEELATYFIRLAPERMLWASDWPHVPRPKLLPNDAALFDRLEKWAPDEALRRRILVENPSRLYWSQES